MARGEEFGDAGRLPVSPTGRVPQWVRDEAAGRPVQSEPWRAWGPEADRPRRRRRRGGGWLTVLVVIGVIAGAAFLIDRNGLLGGRAVPVAGEDRPTPGFEAAGEPLGTPAAAPVEGGTHAFVGVQPDSGRPVAYDPCRPIHYVVRPDNAPPGGDALLREAFDRVTAVTGLQFVDDGGTDEQPSEVRPLFQPDRYGDRWAPVLITWETAQENPDLVTAAGMAGSSWLSISGEPGVYVTGTIALDSTDFGQMLAWPNGAAAARAVVLHEIGHLVGLDHVGDPTQLMYPQTSTTLDFAAGDLTGLVQLGQGACVPAL